MKPRVGSYHELALDLSLGQARILGEFSSLVATPTIQRLLLVWAPSGPGTSHGNLSPWSLPHMRMARPTCLRLFTQLIRWARALALARAGRSKPARMAMMAMTTNSSMRVKAFFRSVMCLIFRFLWVLAADFI